MHVNRDNREINLAFSFMLLNNYKCLRLASPDTSHVIAQANDELSILVAFPRLSHKLWPIITIPCFNWK